MIRARYQPRGLESDHRRLWALGSRGLREGQTSAWSRIFSLIVYETQPVLKDLMVRCVDLVVHFEGPLLELQNASRNLQQSFPLLY